MLESGGFEEDEVGDTAVAFDDDLKREKNEGEEKLALTICGGLAGALKNPSVSDVCPPFAVAREVASGYGVANQNPHWRGMEDRMAGVEEWGEQPKEREGLDLVLRAQSKPTLVGF